MRLKVAQGSAWPGTGHHQSCPPRLPCRFPPTSAFAFQLGFLWVRSDMGGEVEAAATLEEEARAIRKPGLQLQARAQSVRDECG